MMRYLLTLVLVLLASCQLARAPILPGPCKVLPHLSQCDPMPTLTRPHSVRAT